MKPPGRGRSILCLLSGGVLLIGASVVDLSSVFSGSVHMLDSRSGSAAAPADMFLPPFAGADQPQRQADTRLSIVIDDFETSDEGGFPLTWKAWRGDDGLARGMYSIQEEDDNRFLHADDDGSSIIIRKKLSEWDANEYPVLSWRWRARVLPEDGDERIGSRNDSSVAVYVVLDQNFIGVPKTLKYVWSTTLPVGTYHRREGIGRPHVIVLESGTKKLGQWVEESVDVYADYVRIFGKKPPRKAVGIGILTDGNATGTDSQGDYDDFVIHRRNTGS